MKYLRIAAVLALAVSIEAYEEEFDESLHENDNKNIYFEIPVMGNGFAFLYPSRVFSVKMDLSDQFGLVAEPIFGHNIIRGFGSTGGFYHRNGKNHNGLKYAFIHLDRYGALHEFFYDYDRYIRTKPGINLRYGLSAGIGMKEFSENRQEEEIKIEYGPTFRLHIDVSYLIKYD